MMNIVFLIINPMEVFGAYLLYHKLIGKRASFRLQRVMLLIILGIIIGIGYIYVNSDIMRSIAYLLLLIIILKVSNLRWSSSFIFYSLNVGLLFFLQVLTAVITLLPIKEFYIMALLGDSLHLLLIVLIYWKIPISKLFQLTEQNLVIKFMFFIVCAGMFVSFIILEFNVHKVSPYILYYLAAVLFSGLGIWEMIVLIRKYVSEIPAKYHAHDNLIAGLVSLYMVYGNEELRENVRSFLEGFGKKEYADRLLVNPDNEENFLTVFLNFKQGNISDKKIKITWDINYIDNKRVSKTDTIKIIAIMLDNAIEHCDKGQDIFLEILITEHIFDVEVKNPYLGSVEEVSEMFQNDYPSKKEGAGGQGLNNLWTTVNRLNGKVMVQSLGGIITFKVVI